MARRLLLAPPVPPRRDTTQDAGAGERQLRGIAAEGVGEVSFRDGGRRARGLAVQFTDVERLGLRPARRPGTAAGPLAV